MEIEKTFICYLPIEKVFVKVYAGVVLIPQGIKEIYFMETKEGLQEIDKLYFKSIKRIY